MPESGPTTDARRVDDVDVGDGLALRVSYDDAPYDTWSDGGPPPLLLLHGFTGALDAWDALRLALRLALREPRGPLGEGGRLTAVRATIAVDLPGHGASGAPADPARYALDRTADDLARVLDALGAPRAAVLGYSFGGRAALRFALRHPGRVDALVLESASPGIADPAERAARAAADAALADAIERDGVAAFVDRWERLPLWASQAALPEAARTRLRRQRLANHARGLANSLRGAGAGADPPVLPALGALRAPTLVIAGALDAKYVALGETMAAAIPGARLAVVAGAGHAVHLERPAVFAEAVGEFLARADGGAA